LKKLILIVVVGAGVFVTAMAVGRFSGRLAMPFEGEFIADLGTHEFRSPETKLEHVFQLRNVTDEPIEIEGHTSSCGCTDITFDSTTIDPGATMEVGVTVAFITPGQRRETVQLFPEGYRPIVLRVAGTVRRKQEWRIVESAVLLDPASEKRITLIATDHETDNPPGKPIIDAPEGVVVEFEGWRNVFLRDEHKGGRPARWPRPAPRLWPRPCSRAS